MISAQSNFQIFVKLKRPEETTGKTERDRDRDREKNEPTKKTMALIVMENYNAFLICTKYVNARVVPSAMVIVLILVCMVCECVCHSSFKEFR